VLSGFAAPAGPIAASQARQRLRGQCRSRIDGVAGYARPEGCGDLNVDEVRWCSRCRRLRSAWAALRRSGRGDFKDEERRWENGRPFPAGKKKGLEKNSKPSKGERCLVPRPGERCPVARAGVGQALSGTRRGAIMFSGRRMSASMASSSKPSSRTSSSTPRPLSRAMRAIRVAFS